jgi:hypothetical protein
MNDCYLFRLIRRDCECKVKEELIPEEKAGQNPLINTDLVLIKADSEALLRLC